MVEAYIDFPEEDIESLSLKDMKKRARAISQSLKKLIESSRYGMILRDGLKTAIIGRPNVGKSSLLNALLEHDRAIVTEIPGTTRDVIEEYLNIQGLPIKIMDTAGIRDVKDIAEQEGVKRSLGLMDDADLVLLVLDGSEPLHDTDRELIEQSKSGNTIIVINKCDLTKKIKMQSKGPVRISAKKETGLDALKDKIVEMVAGGHTPHGVDVVTNIRHLDALERAQFSVNSFLEEVSNKTSPEFLALELRDALDAIGEILGITTPDDILNRIFDNFCIGK
jgi:tRNA modification GTPase